MQGLRCRLPQDSGSTREAGVPLEMGVRGRERGGGRANGRHLLHEATVVAPHQGVIGTARRPLLGPKLPVLLAGQA